MVEHITVKGRQIPFSFTQVSICLYNMAKESPLQKKAMKRLMLDLQELEKCPLENVSAVPLENDMLEWHCNCLRDDVLHHLILFFPSNYPYTSPSAEFVPAGFKYDGGTRLGKKGTQVCLSISSDYANWHSREMEKGAGWSPGYTVQTILLNVVSFLANAQRKYLEINSKRAKDFECPDCSHTEKNPYPPLKTVFTDSKTRKESMKASCDQQDIVCYISKETLNNGNKPKSNEELYGFCVGITGPRYRPSLTTPCEFINGETFSSMMRSRGVVYSVRMDPLKFFLPLYLHPNHGSAIKNQVEKTLKKLAEVLPKCNPKKTPMSDMVIKVIPNLMSAAVVEFSKGTQHTSDNHLRGYFALHRLLLWALETYPGLQEKVDELLKVFIEDESARTKQECPHIAERLMLLSASAKYRWKDMADAYVAESWRRNVMWYVKGDALLGYLDTDKDYRLANTLESTEVSRKILAFQVLFLEIAMPEGVSHDGVRNRYDNNFGFPTEEMIKAMKEACARISNMKSYTDWYHVLKLDPLYSDDEIFRRLRMAVNFAIETYGYHWTLDHNPGDWPYVLRRYKREKKEGKIQEYLGADF